MIQILHNNRCTKSRGALKFLDEKGQEYNVRYYLEKPLSVDEIKDLLQKLNLKVNDIIRTNEALWKENFAGESFSEGDLIEILAENPKLLQRPIIIKDNQAVIGRPTENIEKLLS